MARFSVPQSPGRSTVLIEQFKGVDLYNSPSNVDITRSPNAPNMIRDVPGKVRKRMGYRQTDKKAERINGIHRYKEKVLVHAGTKLYDGEMVVYTGMADTRSQSWMIQEKLYLLDGKKLLVYGEFTKGTATVKAVEDIAYIPNIIISRSPTGGGTTLEPINLLSKKWKESFLGTETDRVYQLTAKDLDSTEVVVRKLTSDGTWGTLKENASFTVDRITGKVTFTTAPGVSPVTGQDNVEITASKVREGYLDKINKCSISTVFGVNGSADRLFVSGNPDFPNKDWYSQLNDPTYFGDLWYSSLGQDNTQIMGYSIINDRLAAHKNESEDARNVILRQGILQDGKATFPVTGTLQGRGAISRWGFAYLQSEPLFMTRLGVMAITSADMTGEKYSQDRSFYINKALMDESLKESIFFAWRDFVFLTTGSGKVYVLDGLQKSYEKNTPYSTYQYECYTLENIFARVFFEDKDGNLCFGTETGEVMTFYNDSEKQSSYQDNGKVIKCRWDLPDIDGKLFYKNKTFRRIDVRLASAIATGVKIWVLKKGLWSQIYDAGAKARYFDFSYIDFSAINFTSDATPRTLGTKVKVKKVDKARFSLRNEEWNQPFGVYSVALEYTENGNYKG